MDNNLVLLIQHFIKAVPSEYVLLYLDEFNEEFTIEIGVVLLLELSSASTSAPERNLSTDDEVTYSDSLTLLSFSLTSPTLYVNYSSLSAKSLVLILRIFLE